MKGIFREPFPDGTVMFVSSNFAWDLTLPGGRHVRGTAGDLEAAKLQLTREYFKYIYQRWQLGKHGRRGEYICELTGTESDES